MCSTVGLCSTRGCAVCCAGGRDSRIAGGFASARVEGSGLASVRGLVCTRAVLSVRALAGGLDSRVDFAAVCTLLSIRAVVALCVLAAGLDS